MGFTVKIWMALIRYTKWPYQKKLLYQKIKKKASVISECRFFFLDNRKGLSYNLVMNTRKEKVNNYETNPPTGMNYLSLDLFGPSPAVCKSSSQFQESS